MMQEENFDNKMNTLKSNETWRIVKNVVIISVAFVAQFTAYNGAANLQSSINAEAGVGTASLAAVYAGLILSSLFLPVVVIKWLGTKWTICLSILLYMPYIAAQLKPTFYIMIPAGLLVGLGGGPLWCAKCTYLAVVSEAHSKISKIPSETLLARFMGLFFMIFQLNQITGNLISSLVLRSGDNVAAVTSVNDSMIPELCGANFLPTVDAGEALPPQPPEKIQMIAGIYLGCIAAAALTIAVGVDSMTRYDAGRKSETSQSGSTLLSATLRLLMEPNQILLVIIITFSGYQEGFFGADVTAAFVSCTIGIGSVGFVMMAFGGACAIGSAATGYLVKLTGRVSLICVATALHCILFVIILAWRPRAGMNYVIYIMAVAWGLCDAIWIVILNALSGILFPGREEAAFAINHFWKAVGYIIAYIISPYLRTSSKTYLMIVMMVTGVTGYFIVEVRHRRFKATKTINEINLKKTDGGCDNKGYEKDLQRI